MFNALGQTLLKITCPGVPDFYQGSELWDFHLVDPDNRDAIDFTERRAFLQSLMKEPRTDLRLVNELVDNWPDGRIKLYLIWRALNYRREHPALFAGGEFISVTVSGERRQHLIAFLRRLNGCYALTVIPRWLAEAYTDDGGLPSADFWGDTKLSLPHDAPISWRNVFTGRVFRTCEDHRELAVSNILADFPEGFLVGD